MWGRHGTWPRPRPRPAVTETAIVSATAASPRQNPRPWSANDDGRTSCCLCLNKARRESDHRGGFMPSSPGCPCVLSASYVPRSTDRVAAGQMLGRRRAHPASLEPEESERPKRELAWTTTSNCLQASRSLFCPQSTSTAIEMPLPPHGDDSGALRRREQRG